MVYEINRRDFLKTMVAAATGVTGLAGTANAELSITHDKPADGPINCVVTEKTYLTQKDIKSLQAGESPQSLYHPSKIVGEKVTCTRPDGGYTTLESRASGYGGIVPPERIQYSLGDMLRILPNGEVRLVSKRDKGKKLEGYRIIPLH